MKATYGKSDVSDSSDNSTTFEWTAVDRRLRSTVKNLRAIQIIQITRSEKGKKRKNVLLVGLLVRLNALRLLLAELTCR
jgi:hypothetical protein